MVYLDMKISPANGAWRLEIQQMGHGDAWKLGDKVICWTVGGRYCSAALSSKNSENILSKF